MTKRLRTTTGDVVAIGLVLLGAAVLFWNTFSFAPPLLPGYPGDALFPRLILGLIAVCGIPVFVVQLGRRLRQAADGGPPADGDTVGFDGPGFVTTLIIALAFPLLLPVIGFELTTIAVMTALLAPRSHAIVTAEQLSAGLVVAALLKSLLYAILTMLILYAVFVLMLNVHMPLLFFPRYF